MNPTDVFTTMLHGVDTLDWDTVRACYTERVDVDYTSLWGGEPATVPIDDLIADWTELATGFDATQHDIRLRRDEPGRWRIQAITLHLAYEDGDRRLVDLARQRSVAGVGGRAG